MSARLPMELRVAAWMADEAGGRAPDELLEAILDTTTSTRPSPRVVALVAERPLVVRRQVLVGQPGLRLALVAAAVLLAALAVVAGAWLLRPPTPDDWPGFRGGADRTGVGQLGPVGHPVVRWRFAAGAPVTANVALTGGLVLAVSGDGVLHAIEPATGAERWAWRPGVSITGPTTFDGTAYLADGEGSVRAIDVASGAERWHARLGLTGVSDIAATADALYLGTGDGLIVALDRSGGAERWRHRISAGSIVRAPAVGDGLVVAATEDGTIAAFRADTGERAWAIDGLEGPLGTPVVAAGLVFSGPPGNVDTGRLVAVDLVTGAVRWQLDEALFSPSVAGSLAINAGNPGAVTGRDLVTGAERWRVQLDGVVRPPAIAGGIAYLAADDLRQVIALDAATGGELWRLPVEGSNGCCIAAAGGLVVFGTDAGFVYAISGDGASITPAPPGPTGSIPLSSPATASPSATTAPVGPTPSPAADVLAVVTRFPAADLGLDGPIALAVAPTGDIYVTDRSDRVARISRDGRVIDRWGGLGRTEGRFDFAPAAAGGNVGGSITVGPEGNVYVSDSDNHRVQVFTPDGRFVRTFGSLDPAEGALLIPFDLGVDAAGNVFVADDGTPRLNAFDATGAYLWSLDGSDDPVLHGHLHGLVFDRDGRLLVLNDDLGTAAYLDDQGRVLDTFAAAGGCTPSLDPAGNVWVHDCEGQWVKVFGPDHALIGIGTGLGIGPPQFGPDGEIAALSADDSVVLLEARLP